MKKIILACIYLPSLLFAQNSHGKIDIHYHLFTKIPSYRGSESKQVENKQDSNHEIVAIPPIGMCDRNVYLKNLGNFTALELNDLKQVLIEHWRDYYGANYFDKNRCQITFENTSYNLAEYTAKWNKVLNEINSILFENKLVMFEDYFIEYPLDDFELISPQQGVDDFKIIVNSTAFDILSKEVMNKKFDLDVKIYLEDANF